MISMNSDLCVQFHGPLEYSGRAVDGTYEEEGREEPPLWENLLASYFNQAAQFYPLPKFCFIFLIKWNTT